MDRTYRDYENDPQFRILVDTLYSMMQNLQTTPSELRAAVMCAAIKLENGRIKPPLMRLDRETGDVTFVKEEPS